MTLEKRAKAEWTREKELLFTWCLAQPPGFSLVREPGSAAPSEGSSWNSDCEQDLFSFPGCSGKECK